MSDRRGSRPPLEDQDEGPTRENYVGSSSQLELMDTDESDGILTEEDIDAVPTMPKQVRIPIRGGPLPRFEGTGSLTLPRGFLASHTPAVLPDVRPRLPPPTPFRVLPPPPRFALAPEDEGESSFSLAPTPIQKLPSVPPPKPPPRRSSRPPPKPPSRPPDRPRAPLASAPPPNEATRPFALAAPRPPAPSTPSEPDVEIDPRLVVAEAPPFPPASESAPPPPSPMEQVRSSPRHPSIPPPARPSAPPPHPLSAPPPAHPSQHLSTPPPSRVSRPAARIPTERPPRPTRRRELPLPANPNLRAASMGVLVALVVGALVMMLVMVIRSRQLDDQPQGPVIRARPLGHVEPTRTEPAAPTGPTAPTAFAGCSLVRTVERLASSAMPNVVPMGARAPGLDRVALGYASTKSHAEGIIVDLDDLSVESRYSEELPRPVLRVTPLADRSPVTFAVDADVANVQAVRTIPSSPPVRVGVTYFGFVRLNETGETTVIWPGGRNDGIGEPAFATTERDGYGVAFRSGRTSGDVFAGWLTPSGTADGDLVRIDAGAREVGAPSIGANERNVVVVFPARAPGGPWRLRLATAKRAKVPRTSRELDTGPADALSPSIAALPTGGWLLQWIEGTAGARRVVVRALDRDLQPVGLPLEVASGPGVQNVTGALVPRQGRVLAVHLSATERSVGLWGAVLRCG